MAVIKESRVAKKAILTRADFIEQRDNTRLSLFTRMLNNNLYSFLVKKALYENKKISAKGFLNNDDIYKLPLGVKNGKGEILIDNCLLNVFDRYLLTEELIKKGDALTAFLVDNSEILYTAIKTDKEAAKEDRISEAEYVEIFNMAYSSVSDMLLNQKINDYIDNTPELLGL